MIYRGFLLFSLLQTTALQVSSQITFHEYPRKLTCEVGFTGELPVPEAATNCSGEIHITQNEEMASGGCAGVLIRKFIYADDCGNTAEAEQYVTLKDTEAPQLVGTSDDIHLEKNQPVPLPDQVRSWDNTDKEYPVAMTETVEGPVIIRTWTCSDDCDNTVTHTQRIYMAD
jgi:large repetitive protein